MKQQLAAYTSAFVLAILLMSCQEGGRPSRKKLPEITDEGNSWEANYEQRYFSKQFYEGNTDAYSGYFFYIKDTAISGKVFLSLAMPDPASDSLAYVLLKAYRPMANSAFVMLENQGKQGILVDFRSDNGGSAKRADYTTKNFQNKTLSLIFLWDHRSSERASLFMNELQYMPAVRYRKVDESGR